MRRPTATAPLAMLASRAVLRALVALVALPALAGRAAALGPASGPPDLGEALRELERVARPARNGEPGLEQTVVLPERAGQNQVAWFDFDWRYVDVPSPAGGPAGLRLYFARSAAAQASRALPAIRSAYARLVAEFAYAPTRTIPYILFATQREFETQNVFQVTESVLGVTSPEDLKMSVPYFGDHARFLEVSTHELVHQFTIQKLLDAAGGDAAASPVHLLPLWLIEGIAEFYTKGGLDAETEGYLRDLVWNPDPERHYQVVPFAEDEPRGYVETYKLGQARVAFVADAYGREKVQALLEDAVLLGHEAGGPASRPRTFSGLVRRVLGEPIEQVDARWRAWLRRRTFEAYGRTRQDLPQVREVHELPAEPEAFVASPDGATLLVRGIDREKGRARLYLADLADPGGAVTVAEDAQPGSESLHPIDYGVMALAGGLLAFSSRDGIGDRLTVRRWRRLPGRKDRPPRLEVGPARRVAVRPPGGGAFVRIADPAFSPDASQLAFVGVAADGQQDLYVVPVGGGVARRLTDDFHAERELAWGEDGIYCASDATDHGRFNLFRVDPATGARTRLTTWPADDRSPRPVTGGAVLFATEAGGRHDLARLEGGAVRRLTDFATGLRSPAPAPGGRGLLASTFHGGRFRLVEVPRLAWLDGPPAPVEPPAGGVLPIPAEDLPGPDVPYRALSPGNWRPEAGLIYGGASGDAVGGRAAVLLADQLRDHLVLVDVGVYGSWELTEALVLFENRSRRNAWALGAFHVVQPQLDRLDPFLTYLQRDTGLTGILRLPLDRYRRAEVELSAGVTERYCLDDSSVVLDHACAGLLLGSPAYQDLGAWRALNGGVQPTLQPVLRLGLDTLRHDPGTGPLDGTSVLLELGGGWLPRTGAVHGHVRVELGRWWQLWGRSNLMLRLAGAESFSPDLAGRIWERSWWLSAADNLRGYSPFDTYQLVGRGWYVANLELQVPLDPVLRLVVFQTIEGVAALDFGGVYNAIDDRTLADGSVEPGAWGARTLTGVLGVNAVLGPLLLRLHFGHPFDIGGRVTPALAFGDRWVTNFTLRWLFF